MKAKFLYSLMALLGFSSMSCDRCFFGCEAYGTPPVEYARVRGRVVDVDNHPLNGIQVGVGDRTTLTDGTGKYYIRLEEYMPESVTITATDIDGEENHGLFKSRTITQENENNEMDIEVNIILELDDTQPQE
jgi:putative lipoprotein (rSAM/lipoprotein system)